MGKMSAYETDVNLPFYVRGPGVPKGIQLPHLVGGSQLPHLVGRSDVLWGSCRPGRLQGLPAGQQRVVVLLGGGAAGQAASSGCPACSPTHQGVPQPAHAKVPATPARSRQGVPSLLMSRSIPRRRWSAMWTWHPPGWSSQVSRQGWWGHACGRCGWVHRGCPLYHGQLGPRMAATWAPRVVTRVPPSGCRPVGAAPLGCPPPVGSTAAA